MAADDVEEVYENLEVLEEQLSKQAPKKTVIKTLLATLKGIMGTAEFGAAVVTLAQFIESKI